MSRFRLFTGMLSLLLGGLALFLPPSTARADGCVGQPRSHAAFARGYDWFCIDGGGACAQCAAAWSTGYSICTSDSGGFHICIDYPNQL
ncbi:MAG: hypothetical protein M3O15_16480 [Acidobacteriota bacterium]|nr:hypothetical protein [Acidobacteriota bacterium]